MAAEITVDTNVFMHADNQQNPRRKASLDLLEKLRSSDVLLCVDKGLNLIEAKNRSQIFSEYIEHLVSGSVGYETVAYLATNSRFVMKSKSVSGAIGKKIVAIVHDKSDRVFVKVTFNSADKRFTTHDDANFPANAIDRLEKEIGVIVVDAEEASKLIP